MPYRPHHRTDTPVLMEVEAWKRTGSPRMGRSWRRFGINSPQRAPRPSACATTRTPPAPARTRPSPRRPVLRGELQSSDERAASAVSDAEALRGQLAEAAARARVASERYRDLVVRTQPELPPELIAGDDVDAIDAAVESARAVVGRVRTHIEAQAHAARVPAGAPSRAAPDLSALTPEQKIRHGLASQSQP